jgi:hypothetical protein
MPSSRFLISSTTLTGTQTTITFSSIPNIYTDLVLKVSTRLTSTGGYFEQMFLRLNGITSNYSSTMVRGNGSVTGSNRNSSQSSWNWYYTSDSSTTASTFSGGEVYIPNYTSSQTKVASIFSFAENNSTTAGQSWIASTSSLSNITNTITDISISANSTYAIGSSFYLYGIKNS